MGKLHDALAWAERGFPVFPVVANSKVPLYEGWTETATTDPATITAWWTDPVLGTEANHNIGCLCSDRVIIDVDVKKGKNGAQEYLDMGGHGGTLTVGTPSGGFHYYFDGPNSSNAGLSDGVDVRSFNGYTLAPGSEIDGVAYTILRNGGTTPIPEALSVRLSPADVRVERTVVKDTLDSPAAVQAATNYLQSCPPAIEGQRGDEITFKTAARLVRELALTSHTAWLLMMEHWNPRCSPPWDGDELLGKVENAEMYGTAGHALLSPDQVFANIEVPRQMTLAEQTGQGFGNATLPDYLPPRPWMMDRTLMLHEVSLLVAPGSAGKSSVSLAIGAHMAMGLDFGDRETKTKCKVAVYNGEDNIIEQSRRLAGVCLEYNLDFTKVREEMLLLDGRSTEMNLVTIKGREPSVNWVLVEPLIEQMSDPEVGVLILDPLVDLHNGDESDNAQMNFVMKTLQMIAFRANVAVLLLHHTAKAGGSKMESRIGNMDIVRGASGIVYKSRMAFTLMGPTDDDCEHYGFSDDERRLMVRMDDAKTNLVLAGESTLWFKKAGVKLINGDIVGVLKTTTATVKQDYIKNIIAGVLSDTLVMSSNATLPMSQAVAVVKEQVAVMSNKTDTEVRKKLEGLFVRPCNIGDHSIRVGRVGESTTSAFVVILE